MVRIKLTISLVAVLLTGNAALAQASFQEPAASERFLREAPIVQHGPQDTREEHAHLALLSDGRTTMTVLLQTLQPYRYRWFRSRDSIVYAAAAYKLDRLMRAGVVPCTVLRKINGQLASVTIWNSDREPDHTPRAILFRALVGDAQGAFTSGFYASKTLGDLEGLADPDSAFLTALSGLNREQLNEELGDLLTRKEIRFLLARRDRILRRYGS